MKNILKILAVFLFSAILFNSCEKDDPDLTFGGPYFIAFEDASTSISESSSTIIEMIVLLSAPAQSSAVTVTFAVSSPDDTAVEGTDYEVLNTTETLTFAPGVYSDTIFVTVSDNLVEDGNKTIEATLVSSNVADFELGLPGDANTNIAHTISIVDDDCAFVAESWEGTPVGTETYGANTFAAAAIWTIDDSYTEATDTKVRYLVQGFMTGIFAGWGETVTTGGTHYVILDYTNPLSPTITFESVLVDPDGVGRTDFYATTDDGAWGYYIELNAAKTSVFSTCNQTITIHYLVDVSADNGAPNDQSTECTYDVTFN